MIALKKLLFLVGVSSFLIGCETDDQEMVQRASVSGKVTLDGKPLEAGIIVFHSDPKKTDGAAVNAFSFVENGFYHIDADQGPAIGSARVEFRSKPLQREQLEDVVDHAAKSRSRHQPPMTVVEIPTKYGSESKLQVEMLEGENNHDFQLDSRR